MTTACQSATNEQIENTNRMFSASPRSTRAGAIFIRNILKGNANTMSIMDVSTTKPIHAQMYSILFTPRFTLT